MPRSRSYRAAHRAQTSRNAPSSSHRRNRPRTVLPHGKQAGIICQLMPLASTYGAACRHARFGTGLRPLPFHTTAGSTGSNASHTSSGNRRAKLSNVNNLKPSLYLLPVRHILSRRPGVFSRYP